MATLKEMEYDYKAAKKKNNRIKMTTISKLITEIKILSAKKDFSEPPQQLIDAVVIKNIRRIKANILFTEENKQDLMYKITAVLGERVDLRVAAVALEELINETE